MPKLLASILSLACLAAAGCAHNIGHFRYASLDPKEDVSQFTRSLGTSAVQGESCAHYILFIPVSGPASVEKAYDAALAAAPGAEALVDAKVEDRNPVLSFLYNKCCYRVVGQPVAFTDAGAGK